MMKKITRSIATLALTIMLSFAATNLYAQPGGVPEDPSLPSGSNGAANGAVGHPAPSNGTGASLKDGVWLLLLLGGSYGCYKVYQVKKTKGLLSE